MEISDSENSITVLNTDIDAVSENNCSFLWAYGMHLKQILAIVHSQ